MTTAMTREQRERPAADDARPANPWNALWAMMIGFFMILVDSTIVAVANPSIMDALKITDYDVVIWVTSAYLLAYAVPLLLAGALGDRFGPKNLYVIGLVVFTAASLWCGLAGTIGMLIAARVVQGVGAGLLTPQTLSTITRIFPPERRGVAMSVWGATAGVATLVGPLAGGVLVDHLGWEWIFFVNVPIGIIGVGLALWLVPTLPTHKHRFDVLGVVLSGIAMFLIVFGLQEGQSHHWSAWIWLTIVGGIAFMVGFVYWQSINKHEPLVPLRMFRDRDFSLANIGIAVIGFAVTAMILPVMFYAQAVCGLTPTRSALLTAPMAIATGLLAPVVGRIVDRSHPRPVIGFGFSALAIALTWLSIEMTPTTPIWRIVLPLTAMGVGMAFIWAPLGATATRNLPPQLAGAGSGVYNTTRQVGSVLGSAGIAAFMASRISAQMPSAPAGAQPRESAVLELPAFLREPFSTALSQSMLLPAFVSLFGVVAALFLIGSVTSSAAARRPEGPHGAVDEFDDAADYFDYSEDRTERIPVVVGAAADSDYRAYRREFAGQPDLFARDYVDDGQDDDEYIDDDDYVEYTPAREPAADAPPAPSVYEEPDEDTERFATPVEHPRPAPAEAWHSDPVESWRSLLDESAPGPSAEPIGFAHNGFYVEEEHFRPMDPPLDPTPLDTPRWAEPAPADDFLFGANGGGADSYGDHAPRGSDDHTVVPAADALDWPDRSFAADADSYGSHAGRFSDDRGFAPGIADGFSDSFGDYGSERRSRHGRDDSVGSYGDLAYGKNGSRHRLGGDDEPRRPRHHREESDDPATYGRHSLRRD
jgi:EmrB/QacA subfamily drug resistance transporter